MALSYDLDDEFETEGSIDLLDEENIDEFEEENSYDEIDFEALGINPGGPTHAKPGSEEKVLMLAARYAAGVPLWHESDCYEHGPSEAMSRVIMPRPTAPQKN
jgi:hypothetical protein